MEITRLDITIREVAFNFKNNDDEGVVGYGGILNIRPKYQREFVYKDKQRDAVIDTIRKNYPLNVIYWAQNDDGTYEVLDGQQRTISFCSFINNDYSINYRSFNNLTKEEKDQILDYKLMVYVCKGTELEKLEWFKVINIAGVQLSPQELRNAVYTGNWLISAKTMFSKSNCPAYLLGNKYLNKTLNRQEYLETALKWISDGRIEDYMSIHQHDKNANALWEYFRNVIEWVQRVFLVHRNEMKSVEWGELYNNFSKNDYDPNEIETRVKKLMEDEEIQKKTGIYYYIFDNKEKHLNLRLFSSKDKRVLYERQNGVCPYCKEVFAIEAMDADHIVPWVKGGITTIENGQLLCKSCNRSKGSN
jgi:uncharacterized protein YbaR (Trm112 family)